MNPKTEFKRVADSATENAKIVQKKDINGQSRLFGGRLMEWIDETAALAAMRHCGGLVTTCAVDQLVFEHGATLNQVVVLKSKVTYVGNTSIEVKIDTFVEEPETGEQCLINHAYLVFVHVDEAGKPIPIRYGIKIESESEQEEWDNAVFRSELRKERKRSNI